MSFFPCDLAAPSGPVVEWEEPDCLLCGGRNWSPLVEAPDGTAGGTGLWFVVVQCQECGLCFTNPRPTPTCIGQFYPMVYRPHRSPTRVQRSTWHWPGHGRRRRGALPWHGEGRLSDFGCGGGTFLERMHQRGWKVTGLDVAAGAVQRIRSELKLPALIGSLPHPDLRERSVDVITMWQSLEHVHYPQAILKEAYRLLVPGGKLIIAVPNIDSLPFRWFGHAWYGLDLPRHLTHFAPWTLQLMLQRAGFRPGPIRMVRHKNWLRSSARIACQIPDGPCWHHWIKTRTVSKAAAWYSYLTRQSDCIMTIAER